MPHNLTEALIAQRDASRRLYFTAAGCLYHPQAHLVTGPDAARGIALEQAVESALKFADFSPEEEAGFRERAVAATRVVRSRDGRYAFKQVDRPPRRQQPPRSGLLASAISRATPPALAVAGVIILLLLRGQGLI